MNIAVFGWYGHHNAGDERIKECLQYFLQQQSGIKSVDFFDLHEYASKGKTNQFDLYDLIIIGGGGLVFSQCNYHDFIYGINTKIVTLGISIEQPKLTGNAKKFAIALLEKSHVVLVRDQDSANKFAPFDTGQKVKVSHDLTFLKPFDTVPYIHEGRIGINLLPKPLGMKYSTLCNSLVSFMLRQLSRFNIDNIIRIMDFKGMMQILNKQYELLPIPLYCETQPPNMPLYHKNDVEFLKLYLNEVPSQFLEKTIDKCALFLSMRLHGSIFAVQKGIPVLSLSYLPKNRNFMRQVGLEEYVFDIINANELMPIIECMVKEQNIIREKMKSYTETATRQVRKDVAEVLKMVS